ncbi:MAG: EamA family transporter [Acidimicrobiales bacterium]|nr:EamA family transporter [Acidimicrobiales bacterium]
MNRRGWLLFAAMSFLWGIPYLLIKEAVDTISPAMVVAGRTTVGAAVLLPIAAARGSLRPAAACWPWVLAFGAVEMAGPFMLLSHAEQTLPSGLTGLLVATVPLFGAVIAFAAGDRSALGPVRLGGLAVGIAGVALIVNGSSGDGSVTGSAVAEVLAVAVLYSIAPFIVSGRLTGVPGIGTAALSMSAVAVLYLPIGLATQDGTPSTRSIGAVVLLGVVCSAIAFVVFFRLINEVGPARATLFTYVNPVVALTLGTLVLDEALSPGLLIGFPVVLVGCWLAASGGSVKVVDPGEVDRPATLPPTS